MARTPRTAVPAETEYVNPLENPEKSNAEISAALEDANRVDSPLIDLPPDDMVTLPGGLVKKDVTIKTAIVKELTGEDEEALARASQSLNPFHFLDRLLKCGVVQVGNEPKSQTERLLGRLLIGDREALILGIRRATYGEDVEIDNWTCPHCGTQSSLTMQLDDIPVTKMKDPESETEFRVNLRKGGFALVRLATGDDQIAIFEKEHLNQAERETVLLKRCVMSIIDKDHVEHTVQGFPSLVVQMSIPDRHAILRELKDRQPGPKYDAIKYACASCNKESDVAVGIGDLFLDFGWV